MDQKKNGYAQGKRRMNNRTTMAQREDVIRRTVYVSDIDQQVLMICGFSSFGDVFIVLSFAFMSFVIVMSNGVKYSLFLTFGL